MGRNSPGATTSCAVYGINHYGTVLVAKSFFNNRSAYSELITMPEMPLGSFTTLFCYLPGSSQGVLIGVNVY